MDWFQLSLRVTATHLLAGVLGNKHVLAGLPNLPPLRIIMASWQQQQRSKRSFDRSTTLHTAAQPRDGR